MHLPRAVLSALLVVVAGSASIAAADQTGAPAADKVTITTASPEARTLYLKGRDLLEKLRATDGRRYFEQAIAKDPDFALAWLGLANTAGTTKEFIDAVTHAKTLAPRASEGEQCLIRGLAAGIEGDPVGQERHYRELVRLFPNDERAHNQLGIFLLGRQDFAGAAAEYTRATAINREFSPAWNQLGYAYRFLDRPAEAETAFKQYIALLPNDPNPHDSYAELLMKIGRFDESIASYRKALAIEPTFIASYVGIGNNQMFLDKPAEARATLAQLVKAARNTGERRQAHFWTAASFVHQAAYDKAVAEIRQGSTLAEADKDLASVSGDLVQIGDILREAGRLDEAAKSYAEAITTIDRAQVPAEVKQAAHRNQLFEEARLAAARSDLATAKARAADYAKAVAVKQIPFEGRQQHELAGLIALADKQYAQAVAELKQANQQDPKVLYLLATALQGAGDASQARVVAAKSASFNALSFNYAFVRTKARRLSGS
jgi:tetratricopeptide (TPR) repeat protein